MICHRASGKLAYGCYSISKADVIVLIRDWVLNLTTVCDYTASKTTIIRGDLTDQELLERILNEYEIETVFHALPNYCWHSKPKPDLNL